MSFYATCISLGKDIKAIKDFCLKSKYEVALVDFYFKTDFGSISIYHDRNALFKVAINEDDSIEQLNTKIQFISAKFEQLETKPSIRHMGNFLLFDSGSEQVKFKFSDEARQYFNLDTVYVSKRHIEWTKRSSCFICCDIISEQLIGSRQIQMLDSLHINKRIITTPQYVDVERSNFSSINISLVDENFNNIYIKGFAFFKLHFRLK